MKHPFLTFLLAVLVPCWLAMWYVEQASSRALDGLEAESAARVARLALGTLDRDVAGAVEALMGSADTLADPDPEVDAVRAALEGDTVTALDPTESGVDVLVLFPEPGDPPVLRFNQGRLEPGAADLVGRVTGARIALFANRRLWVATDPAPTLTSLDPELATRAGNSPDGVPLDGGVLLALDPRPGTPAAVAAYAEPTPLPPPLSQVMRAVMLLFVVVPGMVAWMLFGWRRGTGHRRPPIRAAVAVLAAVPALAMTLLALQLRRDFDRVSGELLAGDLTRTLSVSEVLGVTAGPEFLREMSGFHAVRVEEGRIGASTLPDTPAQIADLPAPPPSFTASGRVNTQEGEELYVARMLGPSSFVVLLAPLPDQARGALAAATSRTGFLLVAWLLLAGFVADRRTRLS